MFKHNITTHYQQSRKNISNLSRCVIISIHSKFCNNTTVSTNPLNSVGTIKETARYNRLIHFKKKPLSLQHNNFRRIKSNIVTL